MAMTRIFSQERLLALFPPEKTDAFFEALFGGAEEGAYDIRLALIRATERRLDFAFELHQRENKCLACNLTHGLPKVFARHPVVNITALSAELAKLAGWNESDWTWELGATEEISHALHNIPFVLTKTS